MGIDKKIGIFGGTFNPVHYGHLRAAEEVREKLGFEKILFIPSSSPPLKSSDLAPADLRYEMTEISIEGNSFFEISDVEERWPGKSYTVNTIETLGNLYPDRAFYLIVGIDSFLDIPSWYKPERLMALTNFVVISRPGFTFSRLAPTVPAEEGVFSSLDAGGLDLFQTSLKSGREVVMLSVTPFPISSTAIRILLRHGRSIKYLLPDAVESFIISHNLYREGSDDL
ncbi:MAG TPA: nicotinate-nucleotide adenylyltransferase [Thermodesulfovibrionales bacterium]|jgi:nicotinate-nucleotide adenylyltransferase|nr:nicotinate-nucleotide adenylyltransferase [Thermodesulfovibrionales bacterium]